MTVWRSPRPRDSGLDLAKSFAVAIAAVGDHARAIVGPAALDVQAQQREAGGVAGPGEALADPRGARIHAVSRRTLPKHVEPKLVTLRAGRPASHGDDALDRLAAAIRDTSYRLFAERGEVHLVGKDLHLADADPFALFSALERERGKSLDASHAFYLGYEAAKAVTALTLGKDCLQDRALDWGFLTRPEISHGPSRAAARAAGGAGGAEGTPAEEAP